MGGVVALSSDRNWLVARWVFNYWLHEVMKVARDLPNEDLWHRLRACEREDLKFLDMEDAPSRVVATLSQCSERVEQMAFKRDDVDGLPSDLVPGLRVQLGNLRQLFRDDPRVRANEGEHTPLADPATRDRVRGRADCEPLAPGGLQS